MKNFNWAILIGCVFIALAIFFAGDRIAWLLPHSLHGNFHGSLTNDAQFPEFMSEWQASGFLSMGFDEFDALLQLGEFGGTYTTFRTERRVFRWEDVGQVIHAGTAEALAPIPTPLPTEYDIVIDYRRVFSRDLLSAWLNNRITGDNND